jgi:hypothetical protein
MAHRSAVLNLLSAMLASGLAAQEWEPNTAPPFSAYAVRGTFVGPIAPVNLQSHPEAARFRTRLREAARNGPNFAGHYTVATWGCGASDCLSLAIVDENTGRVYFAPDSVNYIYVRFQRTSRLLVVDPRIVDLTEQEVSGPRVEYWYVWDGRALVFRDSVLMHSVAKR